MSELEEFQPIENTAPRRRDLFPPKIRADKGGKSIQTWLYWNEIDRLKRCAELTANERHDGRPLSVSGFIKSLILAEFKRRDMARPEDDYPALRQPAPKRKRRRHVRQPREIREARRKLLKAAGRVKKHRRGLSKPIPPGPVK